MCPNPGKGKWSGATMYPFLAASSRSFLRVAAAAAASESKRREMSGSTTCSAMFDDVAPEHHLFSAVFKNVNGQAGSVAVSRLGAESGEELRGAFEGLELSAVHVRLHLRVDLRKKSLLRLDRGCCNRLVEPVIDLSFVDVNRRVRKNLRVPIHQAPRMVWMNVGDEDVGNVLRRGPAARRDCGSLP